MEEFVITLKGKCCSAAELEPMDQTLVARAKEACSRSYAPYSGFCVGAAVLLEDGTIVEGNNQENVAYPSGLCAERVALFSACAAHPELTVRKIAIAAMQGGAYTSQPVTPCGACRQVMAEIARRHHEKIQVILYGEAAVWVVDDASMLLPLSFDMHADGSMDFDR